MEPINTFQQKPPQYVYDTFIKDSTKSDDRRNLAGLINGIKIEVALDDLRNNEYSLKKDRFIPVALQYHDRIYIFTQEDLNLFGEARTLDEAEKEIANEIVRLYKRLIELTNEQLGPYPRELLAFLKEYIA